MREYSVYLLRDKDGKVYIGTTSQSIRARFNNGNGYRNVPRVWATIVRDGWQSFSHEILKTGLTEYEASEAEKRYIAEYDSTNPDKGYNRELGGLYGMKIISDESRKLMSATRTGVLNHNYGKHFTAEHRAKLSESNLGQKRSAETRANIGKSKSKPVSQYTVDGTYIATYPSGKAAHMETGIDASHISATCIGKERTAGGFLWRFDT